MAKNPQFSEAVILQALDSISSPAAAPALQAGARLAVLDAFDRGIDRDAFERILKHAMDLYAMTSRLNFMSAVVGQIKHTERQPTDEEWSEGVKQVTHRSESIREHLIKEVELLVQCPCEFDTLH